MITRNAILCALAISGLACSKADRTPGEPASSGSASAPATAPATAPAAPASPTAPTASPTAPTASPTAPTAPATAPTASPTAPTAPATAPTAPPASAPSSENPARTAATDEPGAPAQLGPAIDGGVARRPGADLSAQIGGTTISAAPRPATRVALTGHRSLDAADSAPIAARYLATGQPSVKRCFEAAPPARTKLTLRFAVTTDGKLTDASADSPLAPLATCVRDAMTRWSFGPQATQARFELALSLEPG